MIDQSLFEKLVAMAITLFVTVFIAIRKKLNSTPTRKEVVEMIDKKVDAIDEKIEIMISPLHENIKSVKDTLDKITVIKVKD